MAAGLRYARATTRRRSLKSASLPNTVHASTSGLVTGLDARRQTGRTATTAGGHAAALRRVDRAVKQKPDCLDEVRCSRSADETLNDRSGAARALRGELAGALGPRIEVCSSHK